MFRYFISCGLDFTVCPMQKRYLMHKKVLLKPSPQLEFAFAGGDG